MIPVPVGGAGVDRDRTHGHAALCGAQDYAESATANDAPPRF